MNKNKPWSLVVQRVSTSTASIWIGNLFAGVQFPFAARVDLLSSGKLIASQHVEVWLRPYTGLAQGFYALLNFNQLTVSDDYQVKLLLQEASGSEFVSICSGQFRCLPNCIPRIGQKPFTIGFGSCFSNQDDNGQVSSAYAALYDRGSPDTCPDITFLVGDQVYLDIGFASLIPFSGFIRRRIANRYAQNWQALAGVFTRGGTWMLPDDHEYWNDYPFNNLPILALHSLKIPSVRKVWESTATDAANHIQSAAMVEVIDIGADLSICLANLRSQRTDNQFMSAEEFVRLIEWAKNLTVPGVLVIQQLLMDTLGQGERNLPSFTDQYSQLVAALAETGNDILVLSGDVHFGRVASVSLGNKGAVLTEAVASPLSNLKGLLNGLAADVADNNPEVFPPLKDDVVGVPKVKVTYSDAYKVSSKPGRRFSVYPVSRTDEHFMTASFVRVADDMLEVSIDAWRVREPDVHTGLPSPGFESTFKIKLRAKS